MAFAEEILAAPGGGIAMEPGAEGISQAAASPTQECDAALRAGPSCRELAREARRRRERRRKVLQSCTCRECSFEKLEAGAKCPGRACPICLEVPKGKRYLARYLGKSSCEGHGICWRCLRGWVAVKLEEGRTEIRCPGAACGYLLEQQDLQHLTSTTPVALQGSRDIAAGVALWARYKELKLLQESGARRLQELLHAPGQEQKRLLERCQACPRCLRLVERSEGCRSVFCLCDQAFCYECGAAEPGEGCVCERFRAVRAREEPTLGLSLALRGCSLEEVKERLASASLAEVIAGPLLLAVEEHEERAKRLRAEIERSNKELPDCSMAVAAAARQAKGIQRGGMARRMEM